MMNATLTDTREEFLASTKKTMEASRAMRHPFLQQFRDAQLPLEALRTFGILWYKTARYHKQAFPALIWNIPDDNVRFDLIDILREEYGNGDRTMIHASMLQRFLTALGVSEADVEATPTPAGIQAFGARVLEIWRGAPPAYAFGLHFALEYLAASLHTYFADGLEKYPFLSIGDRQYFEFHRAAEPMHADLSEAGFLHYAISEENRAALTTSVEEGITLLNHLWDTFGVAVLKPQP